MSGGGEGCCANADITYSTYLINGRAPEAAPEFAVKRGERVRFRLINAAGATVFRVAVGGHKLTVTHTDGFPVQPVEVDAFEDEEQSFPFQEVARSQAAELINIRNTNRYELRPSTQVKHVYS